MRVIFDVTLCYYYKNFEIIKKKLEKFFNTWSRFKILPSINDYTNINKNKYIYKTIIVHKI